jgi:hypothetical protein
VSVGGEKSKTPCWWCCRQLQGWHGVRVKVDGNEVVVHKQCLRAMREDADFGSRVQEPEP